MKWFYSTDLCLSCWRRFLNNLQPYTHFFYFWWNITYLKEIINYIKKSYVCKIQLTIAINTDEERAMHSKNDTIETMVYGDVDEAIEELFK